MTQLLPHIRHPRTGPTASSGSGRPRLLLGCWFLLLAGLAAAAPSLQAVLGVPWDVVALVMFAPALASAVLWVVARGWFPTAWASVPAARLVRPLVLALLFLLVHVTVQTALLGRWPDLPATTAGVPLLLVLLLQAAGVLGEEVGWRGLVQRAGEELAPAPVVTLSAGILFGATHLGHWGRGPGFMAWSTLTGVLMALAMASVWRGGLWQRMVPAVVIHLGVNLASPALLAGGKVPLWMLPVPAAAGLLVVTAAQRLGTWRGPGPARTPAT